MLRTVRTLQVAIVDRGLRLAIGAGSVNGQALLAGLATVASARASTHGTSRGLAPCDAASTPDSLSSAHARALRIDGPATTATSHVSHAARFLVEVVCTNRGLSSESTASLESHALLVRMVVFDLFNLFLPGLGQLSHLRAELSEVVARAPVLV